MLAGAWWLRDAGQSPRMICVVGVRVVGVFLGFFAAVVLLGANAKVVDGAVSVGTRFCVCVLQGRRAGSERINGLILRETRANVSATFLSRVALPACSCLSQVKDGRWAFTEIPGVYDDNPGELVPDVFGLLRSRWNVNASP